MAANKYVPIKTGEPPKYTYPGKQKKPPRFIIKAQKLKGERKGYNV